MRWISRLKSWKMIVMLKFFKWKSTRFKLMILILLEVSMSGGNFVSLIKYDVVGRMCIVDLYVIFWNVSS